MKFWYFWRIFFFKYFFRQDEIILWGKKRSALFQTNQIIGKSQLFSARSYVYLHGYTQICNRAATMCPPPGPNRVKWKNSKRNANKYTFKKRKHWINAGYCWYCWLWIRVLVIPKKLTWALGLASNQANAMEWSLNIRTRKERREKRRSHQW